MDQCEGHNCSGCELHGGTVMDEAEKTRDRLDQLNSQFPETKKFLEARGLKSVKELDAKGQEELTEHLTKILELLQAPITEGKIN